MATTSSPYTPLKSPEHIRLLRILPTGDEHVVISLEEVALDAVPYECLSYTWDGPKYEDEGPEWTTDCREVICENNVLHIRQNLYDVLLQMRDMSLLGPIWIDALCINQKDQHEKESQVQRMCNVYSGAKRVIVWLGKDEQYTAPAIQYLERYKITLALYSRDGGSRIRLYHEANFTDDGFETILQFLVHRRWFSRLWTIQEIILARDLVFFCGQHIMSFERIWAGVLLLSFTGRRASGLNSCYFREPLKSQRCWVNQFTDTVKRRSLLLRNRPKPVSIGENALTFCQAQTTDPRDKVYGLVGISRCYSKILNEALVVDYALTVQEVFMKVARFELVECKSLEFLSRVQTPEDKLVPNLPSWVPDLTARRVDHFGHEKHYLKAAGRNRPFTPEFEENVLILAASKLDRVIEVGESWDKMKEKGRIQHFLKAFLACGSEYTFTKEALPVAMRRTLIADRVSRRDQYEAAQIKEYNVHCWSLKKIDVDVDVEYIEGSGTDEHTRRVTRGVGPLERFLANPQASLPEVMESLGFPDASDYAPLETSILDGAQLCQLSMDDFVGQLDFRTWMQYYDDPFAHSWAMRSFRRKVFRTERGYVGLAKDEVFVGDEVYLVDGASSIFILRPHNVGTPGTQSGDEIVKAMSSLDVEQANKPPDTEQESRSDEPKPPAGHQLDAPISSLGTSELLNMEKSHGDVTPNSFLHAKSNLSRLKDRLKRFSKFGRARKEGDSDTRDIVARHRKENPGQGSQGNFDPDLNVKLMTRDEVEAEDIGSQFNGPSSEDAGAFQQYDTAQNKDVVDEDRRANKAPLEFMGSFTLACEVYVHGMMYGEAFEDGKTVDFKKVRIH